MNDVPSLPESLWPPQPWLTSPRFAEALWVAAIMFSAKPRKGSHIPYISHLLGTCSIALEHGATEDEAIAALLHDAIEDITPTKEVIAAIKQYFGNEVLRIVKKCSDSHIQPKPPWRKRKARYLARLRKADQAVLLVSASDKLHNARAIVTDLQRHGSSVWKRFRASREGELWYYRKLVEVFDEHLHDRALVKEFKRAVTEMEGDEAGAGRT